MTSKEEILKHIDELKAEISKQYIAEIEPLKKKLSELEAELREYDAEKVSVEPLDFVKIKEDYINIKSDIDKEVK